MSPGSPTSNLTVRTRSAAAEIGIVDVVSIRYGAVDHDAEAGRLALRPIDGTTPRRDRTTP